MPKLGLSSEGSLRSLLETTEKKSSLASPERSGLARAATLFESASPQSSTRFESSSLSGSPLQTGASGSLLSANSPGRFNSPSLSSPSFGARSLLGGSLLTGSRSTSGLFESSSLTTSSLPEGSSLLGSLLSTRLEKTAALRERSNSNRSSSTLGNTAGRQEESISKPSKSEAEFPESTLGSTAGREEESSWKQPTREARFPERSNALEHLLSLTSSITRESSTESNTKTWHRDLFAESPQISPKRDTIIDDKEVSLKMDFYNQLTSSKRDTTIEEVSLKSEPFEKKTEVRRRSPFGAERKSLGDQISNFSHELSEIRQEMKAMTRREESLQAKLASEVMQRQELEQRMASMGSKVHGQDLQADGKKALEDALDQGLREHQRNLEKLLSKEREDTLKRIKQEHAEASSVGQETLQVQLQVQLRESMEQMQTVKNGLEALEMKFHRDSQKQARDQSEALTSLEQKVCAEWGNALETIQQEVEEVLKRMAEEKQLREESRRSMQNGLEALENKCHREAEKQAEALQAVEQKLRLERDDALKLWEHREEVFCKNNLDRHEALLTQLHEAMEHMAKEKQAQEEVQGTVQNALEALEKALQAQVREAMERMAKEKQAQDEVQRTVQNGLEALEIKLDRHTEKQDKDQTELRRLYQEREEASCQKDLLQGQLHDLLQGQLHEAIDQMAKEKQVRDEAQRTMQNGLEALEIKLCRDAENRAKHQTEASKALERKLSAEQSNTLTTMRKEIAEAFNQKDRQRALPAQFHEDEDSKPFELQVPMESSLKTVELQLNSDSKTQGNDQAEAPKAFFEFCEAQGSQEHDSNAQESKLQVDAEKKVDEEVEVSRALELQGTVDTGSTALERQLSSDTPEAEAPKSPLAPIYEAQGSEEDSKAQEDDSKAQELQLDGDTEKQATDQPETSQAADQAQEESSCITN